MRKTKAIALVFYFMDNSKRVLELSIIKTI